MRSGQQKSSTYAAIGLMSGTSLDGLDIAYCEFTRKGRQWKFDIKAASTIKYSVSLAEKLATAHLLSGEDLWKLHVQFGQFCGKQVKQFVSKNKLRPLLLASHGHTVFHQPANGFTCQIGDGAQIAVNSGLMSICDFRSTDVALGGQGAPLVPIGDSFLFSEYDACLNIGGIANISYQQKKNIIAYDICPANILFNYYASLCGKSFDKNGAIAREGKVNEALLKQLNQLSYYKSRTKKSIGREWIEQHVLSLLENSSLSIADKQATAVEHCAIQIARVLKLNAIRSLLITGGGAYNLFLLERLQAHTACQLIVPDKRTVEYKEALIFALLGVLRYEEHINCLKSVTGAKKDNIGGAIYLP